MSLKGIITYKIDQFKNSLFYKRKYPFDQLLLEKIIRQNRELINHDFEIVNSKIIAESHFGYGIPESLHDDEEFLLNKPINDEITYTDLICYFSNKLKNIRYLELGVSVGKNFYQVMHYLKGAYMMGYDLEEINPLLKSEFALNNASLKKWEKDNYLKPSEPSVWSNMQFKNNIIEYISADIYDPRGWYELKDKKFNLILSDASHTPEAILYEYDMMVKYNVLDPNSFIIFWDDLGGKMTKSFDKIVKKMKSSYSISSKDCYFLELSGWVGQYEFKHQIGMIIKL
jgi:hypothetical protein